MIATKMILGDVDINDNYSDSLPYCGDEFLNDGSYIIHYGMPRRSGRYPWGSGDQPFQSSQDFLGRISELRKSNFTYTDENGKTWTGENAISKSLGLTSKEYRMQKTWARYDQRLHQVETAKSLKEDGFGATEIGRKMGLPESTVRELLDPHKESRMKKTMETVEFLRKQVDEKGMVDVGLGVERDLNVSRERLDAALDYIQKADGCVVYSGGIPQAYGKRQQTTQKVLCLPGTEHKEIYDYDKVKTITEYASDDNGSTYRKVQYPESLSSKRVMVRYADDVDSSGFKGVDKDGVIELRRGVDDISLGTDRYSQVRILVDGTHYLKGMAVYSDDMPDGVDVVFNTNKKSGTPMLGDKDNSVLKPIKNDPDNPFGTTIPAKGQSVYTDKNGNEHLSVINKPRSEGDWEDWANSVPSQFLAKQSKTLAKQQLTLDVKAKLDEYNDICSLENPTIKKHLLLKFADGCDSAAVHLKAAALPGQKYHVILPNNTLKDTEVYAPNYANGTKLALIRYPHAGLFEIPILTVNNRNKLGKEMIGNTAIDAVGITSKVAERLSGADFDGDTVMCIPTSTTGRVNIRSKNPLKGLVGFDPKTSYQFDDVSTDTDGTKHYYRNGQEFKVMKNKGREMGEISNLITDMTLAGANDDELARAVRHSMVVIDAEKHKLDYKASEVENGISALKEKYQRTVDADGNVHIGGASTIISKAKGETTVLRRQGSYKINSKDSPDYDPSKPEGAKLWKIADDITYPVAKYDKETKIKTLTTEDGKKIKYNVTDAKSREKYEPVEGTDPLTGKTIFTSKDGTIKYKTKDAKQKSTKMEEVYDANELVSDKKHPMELIYAQYANDMKALANKARLETLKTGKIAYDKSARIKYQEEYDSLTEKVKIAKSNKPKEREVLRRANAEVKKLADENPDMTKDDLSKKFTQTATKYRSELGSIARKDRYVNITDKEWEAIQAGAISESRLKTILDNTDVDALRQRAMPRTTNTISSAKQSRIKGMAATGYSIEEIAKQLGISTSTVTKYLRGKGK